MSTKNWITGILIGIIIGMVVSSAMTYQDWCLNPGGIFHSESQGTQWSFVWDTWISWFLPVTFFAAIAAMVVIYVIEIIKKRGSSQHS